MSANVHGMGTTHKSGTLLKSSDYIKVSFATISRTLEQASEQHFHAAPAHDWSTGEALVTAEFIFPRPQEAANNRHYRASAHTMRITTVISTHNRREQLRHTLALLRNNVNVPHQVIVVDNASTDDTREQVSREFPEVSIFPHSDNSPLRGYNLGFRQARTDYILVLDDDSSPDAGTVIAMLDWLDKNPDAAAAAGNIINTEGNSEWDLNAINSLHNDQWTNLIGCGFMIRRAALMQAGGYDASLGLYYNDFALALKLLALGYRIGFDRNWTFKHRRRADRRAMDHNPKLLLMARNFSSIVQQHFGGLKKLDLVIGHTTLLLKKTPHFTKRIEILKATVAGCIQARHKPFYGLPQEYQNRLNAKYSFVQLSRKLMPLLRQTRSRQSEPTRLSPNAKGDNLTDLAQNRIPGATGENLNRPDWNPPPCYWKSRIADGDLSAFRDLAAIKRRGPRDKRMNCDCAQWLTWYRSPWPDYQQYLARFSFISCADRRIRQNKCAKWHYRPLLSISLPVFKVKRKYLRECLRSVETQVYQFWELCIVDDGSRDPEIDAEINAFANRNPNRTRVIKRETNKGIARTSQETIDMAQGEFVVLLDHDDRLAPEALYEVVKRLNEDPGLDWIYTDHDKISPAGERYQYFLKPDWSPDLLLSYNYLLHLSVIRRSVLLKAGGFDPAYDGAQDYDLYLRIAELTNNIGHLPMVLYSYRQVQGSLADDQHAKPGTHERGRTALAHALERRGISGTAEHVKNAWPGNYCITGISKTPSLAVFCPVSTTQTDVAFTAKISPLENGSVEFIYPRKGETSVAGLARALNQRPEPHVLVLAPTIKLEKSHLQALIDCGSIDGVAASTPKIIRSDNVVDHCGLAVSTEGQIFFPLRGMQADEPAYGAFGQVRRNVSLVSSHCVLLNRKIVLKTGGIDTTLDMPGAILDFCLKARVAGYRIVADGGIIATITGTTLNIDENLRPGGRDFQKLMRRYPTMLAGGDPFYNRYLRTAPPDFGVKYEKHPK